VLCALHVLLLQRGEVEYSLRTFPLGGYVAFPDDDPESPYPKGKEQAETVGRANSSPAVGRGEGRRSTTQQEGPLRGSLVLIICSMGSSDHPPGVRLDLSACTCDAPVSYISLTLFRSIACSSFLPQMTLTCCATAPSLRGRRSSVRVSLPTSSLHMQSSSSR
jgi:membrane-associated protease RseP (regulator of RpoE activity)